MKDHMISLVLQRFSYFLSLGLMIFAFAKAESQEKPKSISSADLFQNADIEIIELDLDRHVQLSISTTSENKVFAQNTQTGEYRNAVVLSTKKVGNTMYITDPIHPVFHFPQDKLGAHKIIDGTATVQIPENKVLVINATSCDLNISGTYKSVYVNIQSGNCSLHHLKGDLKFISVYADIKGDLARYAIKASSRSGSIDLPSPPAHFEYTAVLETISGNIHILETPE